MQEGLNKLAGGIGKAIETVPDLYDDAFKPTVQESGKTIALIPRAINAALVPLRQWIAEREYKLAETEKLLAKKLEHVAEDKIVTPEAYVAVPVIQAISYSMNSKELRNLYANLLAKAMNSDTKGQVHPSFVEIIKQMSPNDALILKEIAYSKIFPLVNLSVSEYDSSDSSAINKMKDSIHSYSYPSITYISFSDYESTLMSLDNLLRLRLIEERYTLQEEVPQVIQESDYYINFKKELYGFMSNENWEYEEFIHTAVLTSLGTNFCRICL